MPFTYVVNVYSDMSLSKGHLVWITKEKCLMQCIIVDEIVRVNMHQRLYLQCGRGLDYHAKRKIDHGPIQEDFLFFTRSPRIMKLRVR